MFRVSLTERMSNWFDAMTSHTNSIIGKVGRIASEDVVLHLVKLNCLPILLCGLQDSILALIDRAAGIQ